MDVDATLQTTMECPGSGFCCFSPAAADAETETHGTLEAETTAAGSSFSCSSVAAAVETDLLSAAVEIIPSAVMQETTVDVDADSLTENGALKPRFYFI